MILFINIIVIVLHLWSAAVIFYCSYPKLPVLSAVLSLAYLFLILSFSRKSTRNLFLSCVVFGVVLFWFLTMKPPAHAVFSADLQMPHARINNDQVTIHKVRNNLYRTREDFDLHYETRVYDLNKLRSLDLMVNYWGLDFVAHTFLAFGFSDGQFLDVSVEIRPPNGDKYDMAKGYFNRYETIYIWGDEHDLIDKRTNAQGEDVYLYRFKAQPPVIRKLFLRLIERTNALYIRPEFYNTTTQSCASTLQDDAADAGVYICPLWKRWMFTGDIDKRFYREGILETYGLPFNELRRRANIDARAKAAARSPDFSQQIRTHLKTGT